MYVIVLYLVEGPKGFNLELSKLPPPGARNGAGNLIYDYWMNLTAPLQGARTAPLSPATPAAAGPVAPSAAK